MNRAQAFEKLWTDAKYLRLQARKDAALRAWNIADANKSRPYAIAGDVAKKDRAAKRACKVLGAYEDAFIAKVVMK